MALDTASLFNQRIIARIGLIGYGKLGKMIATTLKSKANKGVAWVGTWDIKFDDMRDLPDSEMEQAEAVAKSERAHARSQGIAASGSVAQLCESATLIISCVTANSTLSLAEEVAKYIQRGTYYLDLNAASLATKQAAAAVIDAAGGHYVTAESIGQAEHREKLAAALSPLDLQGVI